MTNSVAVDPEETRRRNGAAVVRSIVGRLAGNPIMAEMASGGPLLQQTEAVLHARRWAGTKQQALVLCGGVGTGKTVAALHAAHLLAVEAFAEGWVPAERTNLIDAWGVYIHAGDLPRHVEPWHQDLEAGFRPIESTNGLVILDDLGTEDAKRDRWGSSFCRLLDHLIARRRRLVIATNLPVTAIRRRYDARAIDRLNDISIAAQITGESMRKRGPF